MALERNPVLPKNQNLAGGLPKSEDSWHQISQILNFVGGIDLPPLNTDKSDVYLILTAVPSPWVRSYMMSNALRWPYVTRWEKEKGNLPGMVGLYAALQDEFKGLLACLAIYGSRLSVEKINLRYEDNNLNTDLDSQIDVLKKVQNIYDIAGAFGNMLFEASSLWADSRKSKEEYNAPYFQLIRLDGEVIGATSPISLMYPSANYNLDHAAIPFFKKGRFRDPIDFLDARQLEKLFHYLKQLKIQIDRYESTLKANEPVLLSVREFIKLFSDEIVAYIKGNFSDYDIKPTGVLDYFDKFSYPFDLVFNMDMKIYRTKDGRYLSEKESDDLVEFNPDRLLLDAERSYVVLLDKGQGFNPKLSTVLPARGSDGAMHYFALPLSVEGLNEFYNELTDLLTPDRGENYLSADYDLENGTLNVCLELTISNCKTPFYKRYNVVNGHRALKTNVIVWPNFVSNEWHSYYFYSELPHNLKGLKAVPLFAESAVSGVRKTKDGRIYRLHEDKRKHYEKEFSAEWLVNYNPETLKERHLNYEIYHSEIPFTGVEIRTSREGLEDACCGFILMRSSSSENDDIIINYSGTKDQLDPVTVGIDFGSTNTTATYASNRGVQGKILLRNRRRFVLGKEKNDNNIFALPNELFFFQNDDVDRTIKSALIFHDYLRISNPELGRADCISGGVLVFERNLNIKGGSDSILELDAIPNEVTELLYDLKWKREDKYLLNKKAFIKSVWLCITAELYANARRPTALLWGYPSSMPKDLRKTYESIYQEALDTVKPSTFSRNEVIRLAKMSDDPTSTSRALSESEALCNYALSAGGAGIGNGTILVGIDIGGVTSDLLVLASDPGDARGIVLKQSSVKVAANKISMAIGRSRDLQEAIRYFVRLNKMELEALEKIDKTTANYLVNLLFEEMERADLLERSFYRELWNPGNEQLNRDHTRGLIGIATFICGLLMFHAGQLVRSVINQDKLKDNPKFKDIHDSFHLKIMNFGKGGKLFEWLPEAIGEYEAEKYYSDCFTNGYFVEGNTDNADKLLRSLHIMLNRKNLKMEVGYGLTSPKGAIVFDENVNTEIVGESGYVYKNKQGEKVALSWDTRVTAEHIFEFGEDLIMPPASGEYGDTGFARFNVFLQQYLHLTKEWNLFDHTEIMRSASSFANNNLENYVKSDEDWIAGKNAKLRTGNDADFNFSCSPFIYQGMCFLDQVIINHIYGDDN